MGHMRTVWCSTSIAGWLCRGDRKPHQRGESRFQCLLCASGVWISACAGMTERTARWIILPTSEDSVDRKFAFAGLLRLRLPLASPALAVDKASAVLKDKDGKEVGKAELTDTPSGVLIRLRSTASRPAIMPSMCMRSANASRLISSPPGLISILTRPSMG